MISGQCCFCQKGLFSCCDRINPNAEIAAKAMGQSPAGLFGFTMLGGRSGGQRIGVHAGLHKIQIVLGNTEGILDGIWLMKSLRRLMGYTAASADLRKRLKQGDDAKGDRVLFKKDSLVR